MSRAKRRDEWDRWSMLLALVDERTQFGKNAKPRQPLDWWPESLVTVADKVAVMQGNAKKRPQITMAEIQSMGFGQPVECV